jgi:glyoxalase family protein
MGHCSYETIGLGQQGDLMDRNKLKGLHHVTAITARARQNVDFYTDVLGLRLVKKTVNQDDVSAYHLFYGDEIGRPGTEVTFFDWPMAAPNRPGYPEIAPIGLAVASADSIRWWQRRFDELGVEHDPPAADDGRLTLAFRDPEGQRLELVDAQGQETPGQPWDASPVPAEHTIRGLHHVSLAVGRIEPSERFLREVMGMGSEVVRLRVSEDPSALARQGAGGVHHVAFRTPDQEEQLLWRQRLVEAGAQVTPVIDRYYFRSIYFREPGGNLFEIATDGPGFTADEDLSELGRHLALPPFLEPRRGQIEAGLTPL